MQHSPKQPKDQAIQSLIRLIRAILRDSIDISHQYDYDYALSVIRTAKKSLTLKKGKE
jgi:hypothetical protein